MHNPPLSLVCTAALLAACGSIPNDAASPLEHRRGGAGPAVVVFESGLGDGLSVWNAVQARSDAVATTLAFSRPGYGRSRDAGGERSERGGFIVVEGSGHYIQRDKPNAVIDAIASTVDAPERRARS